MNSTPPTFFSLHSGTTALCQFIAAFTCSALATYSGSDASAQEFRAPRHHSVAAQPTQPVASGQLSVTAPFRQSTESQVTYAPPVHIAPPQGGSRIRQLQNTRPAVQNSERLTRIRHTLPLASPTSPSNIDDSGELTGSGVARQTALPSPTEAVRQTALQQEAGRSPMVEQHIESRLDTEPFLDLDEEVAVAASHRVARQDSAFRNPRYEKNSRNPAQPVSILTRRSKWQSPDRNTGDRGTPKSRPSGQVVDQANPAQSPSFVPEGESPGGMSNLQESMDRQLDDLMKSNELRPNDLRESELADAPRSLSMGEQDLGDRETGSSLLDKTCDEFRIQLLDNPISSIALDISPMASRQGRRAAGETRRWTDRSGNVVATGAMTDWRRGYVILDTGERIAFARLSDADLAVVAEFWRTPTVCSVGDRGSVYRDWCPQTFTWTASSLCHKPLYFENVQLERYGHSHGPFMQPVRSVAHFFVSLVTVPYQSGIHPANECQYALGFYRPGDCAPWLKDPIPISLNGARRQALVTTGLAFIP